MRVLTFLLLGIMSIMAAFAGDGYRRTGASYL